MKEKEDIKINIIKCVSFIPFLNRYVLGRIVGKTKIIKKEILNVGILLIVFALLSRLKIPILGGAAGAINLVLFWVTIYRLYEMYKPERAGIYTILGFATEFLTPFFIFSIRGAEERNSKVVTSDNEDVGSGSNENLLGQIAITQEPYIESMQCECGTTINQEHHFCSGCGRKISIDN